MRLLQKITFATTLLLSAQVMAQDISVDHAWSRASAGPVKNGAAFVTIHNHGEEDKLVAVRSDIAKRTELHTHIEDQGIFRMRPVDAINTKEGMSLLKPGGDHIMLMGLNAPLKEGDHFPLTLVFEKSGEITVDVKVLSAGANPDHAQHNASHDHHQEEHQHSGQHHSLQHQNN